MNTPSEQTDNQQSISPEEEEFLIEMFGPLNKDTDTFHDENYW